MSNIYFFGDTHGELDIDKIFMPKYSAQDFIIVCGDFGVLWSDEYGVHRQEKILAKELRLRERIESLPCTLLFIDGNHENFHRLNALKQVEKFESNVGEYIKDKCYHLRRGHIYNVAGHKILAMGGALSIDKVWRAENLSWWRQEAISEAELENTLSNIKHCKGKIELVITHTCPKSFLKPLGEQMNIEHKIHDENPLKLEQIKLALSDNNQTPKHWIFGHWHSDIHFELDSIQANCLYYHCLKFDKNGELERLNFTKEIREAKIRNRQKYWQE